MFLNHLLAFKIHNWLLTMFTNIKSSLFLEGGKNVMQKNVLLFDLDWNTQRRSSTEAEMHWEGDVTCICSDVYRTNGSSAVTGRHRVSHCIYQDHAPAPTEASGTRYTYKQCKCRLQNRKYRSADLTMFSKNSNNNDKKLQSLLFRMSF